MGVDAVTRDALPWWTGLAARAGGIAVRVLGATWRIRRTSPSGPVNKPTPGERCIFAFWHARMLPLVYTHRGRGDAVLVSRHRDGELITRVIESLGFTTARGSSTRGGEEGLREMLSLANAGHAMGITPDGPRGPAERAKPGLVYLASRTGFVIVPMASAARPVWQLRSWDRFQVPRPFARVEIVYGPTIAVPPDLDAAGTERWREQVETAIAAATETAERRLGART